MKNGYCQWDDCEKETKDGRTYCWMHQKRAQRGKTMSAAPKPLFPGLESSGGTADPRDRFESAVTAYADCPSDDDEAFAAAKRELDAAGVALFGGRGSDPAAVERAIQEALQDHQRDQEARRRARGRAISAGMASARESGARLGPPPKALPDPGRLKELVRAMGLTRAARWLGIAKSTLWERLKAVRQSDHYRTVV